MRSMSGLGVGVICGTALALAISWHCAQASTVTDTLSYAASDFSLFFNEAGTTLPTPSTVTGSFTFTFDPAKQGITTLEGASANLQINSNSISSLPYPVLDYFNEPSGAYLSYRLENFVAPPSDPQGAILTLPSSYYSSGRPITAFAVNYDVNPVTDTISGPSSTFVVQTTNGSNVSEWVGQASTATPSPSLYVTLSPGGPLSTTKQPTSLSATATVALSPPSPNSYLVPNLVLPAGNSTLAQAASDLGFTGFDWVQQITNWVNPDLFPANNPLNPVTTATGPFFDPVAGGYVKPSDPNAQPPFYYNVNDPLTDTWSVAANTNSLSLALLSSAEAALGEQASASNCSNLAASEPYGSALCFFDEPDDPLFTSSQTPDAFTTELVGLCNTPGFGACNQYGFDPLFSWIWDDTYNGKSGQLGSGGIAGVPGNDGSVYYPGGAGGVTILDIDGQPVPEPSSLVLLLPALIFIFVWRIGERRQKNFHSMGL